MGKMVIATYRPKEGKDKELLQLLKEHVPLLRKEGLATDHPVTVMRTKEGVILEIFEWRSIRTIEEAHKNAAVQQLWERFSEVCTYEKLSNIEEAWEDFPGFEPVHFEPELKPQP